MGQQQGKQGVAGYPPPMEGVSAVPIVSSAKVPPVSRIKGLKPRQPKESSWSPVITGGIAIGAGPPSAAGLGLFNEIPTGKPCFYYQIFEKKSILTVIFDHLIFPSN